MCWEVEDFCANSFFLPRREVDFCRRWTSLCCGCIRVFSGRNLPVMAALHKESLQCDDRLGVYYRKVLEKLKEKEKFLVLPLFMNELTEEKGICSLTKREERQAFVQALCSLFMVESPGEDAGFLAYYEEFKDMLKKDYSTKKERQKVTACTTGMGLLVLLLLLL